MVVLTTKSIHNLKDGDDRDLTEEKSVFAPCGWSSTYFDRLRSELGRLEKNRERRLARENQKHRNAASPGSPGSSAPGQGAKSGGTQRKCANCGQIGHIKTNKKYGFPTLCLAGTLLMDVLADSARFSTGRSSKTRALLNRAFPWRTPRLDFPVFPGSSLWAGDWETWNCIWEEHVFTSGRFPAFPAVIPLE